MNKNIYFPLLYRNILKLNFCEKVQNVFYMKKASKHEYIVVLPNQKINMLSVFCK